MECKVYDTGHAYRFVVHLDPVNAEDVAVYDWGKEPPEGRALNDYLADCKREALLLAELELQRRQPPQEIVLE